MSVKQLITAAGIAAVGITTTALAGGPHVAMPAAPAFNQHAYIEVDGGGVRTDWANFSSGPFSGRDATAGKRSKRGYVWGGAIGYQYSRYLAGEIAYMSLPSAEGRLNASASDITIRSWLSYADLKLVIPFGHDVAAFGKAGFGYRRMTYSGYASTLTGSAYNGQEGYWGPMFAVGFQYMIGNDWSANIAYTQFAGHYGDSPVSRRAPKVQMLTLGVAYNFSV